MTYDPSKYFFGLRVGHRCPKCRSVVTEDGIALKRREHSEKNAEKMEKQRIQAQIQRGFQNEDVFALWLEGYPVGIIAEKLNTYASTVSSILRNHFPEYMQVKRKKTTKAKSKRLGKKLNKRPKAPDWPETELQAQPEPLTPKPDDDKGGGSDPNPIF